MQKCQNIFCIRSGTCVPVSKDHRDPGLIIRGMEAHFHQCDLIKNDPVSHYNEKHSQNND